MAYRFELLQRFVYNLTKRRAHFATFAFKILAATNILWALWLLTPDNRLPLPIVLLIAMGLLMWMGVRGLQFVREGTQARDVDRWLTDSGADTELFIQSNHDGEKAATEGDARVYLIVGSE